MDRREFVRLTTSGMAAGAMAEALVSAQVATNPASARASSPGKALMKVGTQHGDSDVILRYLAAFGVNNICSRLPSRVMDDAWSVDSLKRMRERVESFGITLDMVPLALSSSEIRTSENPHHDRPVPNRDKQIEDICQQIRNISLAGITQAKYNLTIIGIPRTESTPGRGPSRYSTFVYRAPVRIRH